MVLSFEQILSALKSGEFKPIYFLHGKEAYFMDVISDYIEAHALSETEKAFNLTILYGKDTNAKQVVDNARRYPMMAPRQVVILREAQQMKDFKSLESYFGNPLESTVFVICYKHGKFNLNSKFGKLLKKEAIILDSKRPYDNEMPGWIQRYLKQKKLTLGPSAANLLAEYLGNNLSKVSNELDKLAINLKQGTDVTESHIEQHIGISKDYNIFELQKALGQKDVLKANRIVKYFVANPKKNPIQVITASLYNYFSKVYMLHFVKAQGDTEILKALGLKSAFFLKEYKVAARNFPLSKSKQVIAILSEYDLKSKGVDYNGVGKPPGELIREMVWRILHL